MRNLSIIISLALAAACSVNHKNLDSDIEDALQSLDYAISHSECYEEAKKARLDSLRRMIHYVGGDRALYGIFDAMFAEYSMWNCDSALFYAHRKEMLANKIGDDSLINDAAEDIASRYVTSGMCHDALNIVLKTDKQTGTFFSENPSRELLMYEIYHNLVISFDDKYSQSEHLEDESEHFEKAAAIIDEDDINHYIYLSKKMIGNGECGPLIILLEEKLSNGGLSVHDKAIVNYWIAKAYETLGDDQNAFLHYARSAREDIESANREYGSLIHVAQHCYKNGMMELAHRYIRKCYEDALVANAKRRLYQIKENISEIETTYEQLSKKRKSIIILLNILLLLLTATLVFAIIQIFLNLRKLTAANKSITDNIQFIRSATRTNEIFLGQFFTIFSDHIDALERYRSRLRVMAKNNDMVVIQQELRSNDFINEELDNLYDIFDKTFLGLFPDFIKQLNELLRPEERISSIQGGKLTNELRVLALIKLGMTESRQIAKFLRLSTATVFNYRVKYRNASLNNRKSFEASLESIHF